MSLGGIIGQAPDLNEYLPKSGGTMTGPLVLSGNPSGNLEAASKQYVDSKASEWKEIWSKSIPVNENFNSFSDSLTISFVETPTTNDADFILAKFEISGTFVANTQCTIRFVSSFATRHEIAQVDYMEKTYTVSSHPAYLSFIKGKTYYDWSRKELHYIYISNFGENVYFYNTPYVDMHFDRGRLDSANLNLKLTLYGKSKL